MTAQLVADGSTWTLKPPAPTALPHPQQAGCFRRSARAPAPPPRSSRPCCSAVPEQQPTAQAVDRRALLLGAGLLLAGGAACPPSGRAAEAAAESSVAPSSSEELVPFSSPSQGYSLLRPTNWELVGGAVGALLLAGWYMLPLASTTGPLGRAGGMLGGGGWVGARPVGRPAGPEPPTFLALSSCQPTPQTSCRRCCDPVPCRWTRRGRMRCSETPPRRAATLE